MRSRKEYRQLLLFLAGFLIGVLYIYFTGRLQGKSSDVLSIQNLMQILYIDIKFWDYFFYLMKVRVCILLGLFMASLALPGKYLLYGFLIVFGCSMGSMLSILIVRYGIKGIFLFLALVFPQDIIYIPAIFSGIAILIEFNEKLFERQKIKYRGEVMHHNTWEQVVLLLGVTIIGVAVECYVNPLLVKWCLKIF